MEQWALVSFIILAIGFLVAYLVRNRKNASDLTVAILGVLGIVIFIVGAFILNPYIMTGLVLVGLLFFIVWRSQ